MKCKAVSIREVEKDNFILSPKWYLIVKPTLEKKFTFTNELTGNIEYLKLNLKKFTFKEKLFIYYLLERREKYNKIFDILKGH